MDDLAGPLRDALAAADYTEDAVAALLGPVATAALRRNETTPAVRRTGDASPLATLVRLFWLQRRVARAAAERALPGLIDRLTGAGLLVAEGGEVAAGLDVRPHRVSDGAGDRPGWVVSDLTPGLDAAPNRVAADHVLGVSSASRSLAALTRRAPVDRALDLGTGCGVQALHLTGHATEVKATDVNGRALWLTRFNAALNEVSVRTRSGSLFDPVAGERFDLVVTNPPFVISPARGERLVYRDSGLPGDQVVERIVRGLPAHLAPDGWGQVLASWAVRIDQSWDERLAAWLDPGVDALVVQREVLDPAAYVELWLRDAGLQQAEDYTDRYDTWLRWLEEQGVGGIGFGWVNLRRTDDPQRARHDLVEWPWDVEQPVAPAISGWSRGVDADRDLDDDALLSAHPVVGVDVRQETYGAPGEADPETIVLRQQRGFRRARSADTVLAGFVGAADGDLTVGQILDALATLLQRDPDALRTDYLPVVRELIREGYVAPQERPREASPDRSEPGGFGS